VGAVVEFYHHYASLALAGKRWGQAPQPAEASVSTVTTRFPFRGQLRQMTLPVSAGKMIVAGTVKSTCGAGKRVHILQ